MILFQLPDSEGGTDGKSVCCTRFLDTVFLAGQTRSARETHGHTRADAATRPHPRAHTRTRPRAHDSLLGFLKGWLFSTFQNFKLFRHFK